MKPPRFLLAILLAVTLADAAPADDMENLRASSETTADTIDASLSNSTALKTSDLIQAIVWQIGASVANLDVYNTSAPSASSSNATETLDNPYFDYIDSVLTLSESLVRRGLSPHGETNLPVFNTLQSLNSIVQTYGMQLSNDNLISRNAYVRTLTAGSSLVDAESVWSGSGSSSPGMKRARWSARPS